MTYKSQCVVAELQRLEVDYNAALVCNNSKSQKNGTFCIHMRWHLYFWVVDQYFSPT